MLVVSCMLVVIRGVLMGWRIEGGRVRSLKGDIVIMIQSEYFLLFLRGRGIDDFIGL